MQPASDSKSTYRITYHLSITHRPKQNLSPSPISMSGIKRASFMPTYASSLPTEPSDQLAIVIMISSKSRNKRCKPKRSIVSYT